MGAPEQHGGRWLLVGLSCRIAYIDTWNVPSGQFNVSSLHNNLLMKTAETSVQLL